MGGPSKKEILSAETLTAYIDGEITDKLLLELFEFELSENPRLQYRLQNMVAIKSQISSIFGTEGLRISEFVKNEIRNTVKSYQFTDVSKEQDDDGGPTPSDAEVLISKLIDGELADSELQMVERLVIENDTYRELYEQLVTSKINISDNLFQENSEPSARVKMNIKSLVARELEKPDQGEDYAPAASLSMEVFNEIRQLPIMESAEAPRMPDGTPLVEAERREERQDQTEYNRGGKSGLRAALEATEPAQNVINLKKRSVVSSLNYYAQRLVPLAAVFVVGLYISPTLFSSEKNTVPGVDLTLRGAGTQTNLGEGLDFISVINEPPAALFQRLYTPSGSVSAQQAFYLELTAPTSGEMFIYLETSEHKNIAQLDKGADPQRLGFVEAGQSVRYPATQNLSIDKIDQLMRVDIEIQGDDEVFNFTKFVRANHVTLEKTNSD